MSTDLPTSSSSSPRPSSPTAESAAESTPHEDLITRLKDIKTIAQLYESGVLKAVAPKEQRRNPEPSFLERVSL